VAGTIVVDRIESDASYASNINVASQITFSNTSTFSGNLLVGTTTAQTGAKLVVTGGIQGIITSGTAVASTSGATIDFTAIPSWVKRITVLFNGVSTNGTARTMVQLGTSGGVTTSGYLGSSGSANFSTGIFTDDATSATVVRYAQVVITNITGNTWVATSNMGRSDSTSVFTSGGGIALSGTLDRIRITTSNGTDTFDAGTINILYEG
jgi:hypothetical protein